VEAYLFISLIYFVFCFSMSKYSQALEKRLATGHAR
jgi:general L-amino acid transport system permease protein